MSPENECPRFKQNAWKKELCSNCFRPKEEHPEKPKRVHIDYKPLPEISPAQSILKGNYRSCDKSRNVSFSNVESEIIGYGGEEYTTDEEEDYSSDEEPYADHCGDPAEDEELKRLTEANTNLNGKPIAVPDKTAVACDNAVQLPKASAKPDQKKTSPPPPPPPLVVVQPFGSAAEQPKSLVFNFLKNKEIAAAARAAAALQRADKKDAESEVQPRKTETKRPSLTRSSLVAHSNEPYLNIKRCSLPPADENRDEPPAVPPLQQTTVEIPMVKLHPPPETTVCGAAEDTDVSARANNDADECSAAAAAAPYKTRTNVPRMGTMHFKLKLAVVASTQKTTDPDPNAAAAGVDSAPEPPPSSSLTSREMAGEPDGKADSDEPGDPTTTTTIASSANRSFLHDIKDTSTPLRDSTTSPKTPLKKTSIAGNSPPECPRSVKRQAPKPPPPPPTPPSVKCGGPEPVYRRQNSAGCSSFSGDDDDDDDDDGGGKPLQPTREKGRPESASPHRRDTAAAAAGEAKPRESSTLPLAAKRPAAACEKKIKTHGGRAGRVGSKIKKFLRFPSFGDVSATRPQPTPCRPKLEIIHPLDVNKSGVEIIHNAVVVVDSREPLSAAVCRGPNHHYAAARPTKPPPPPRSHPPVAAKPPKTLDDSCSASDEPSVNFSAPECDRGSPEMARLASLQYCGSETESEIYPPAIQFGDDFGAEDSIRNTQPGHKSLEESYDAVVVANHEALTKLLDQATSEPKVPKEFMALKTTSLELSSFHVDPTNWFNKSDCAFFNSKWYDMPVVLSISSEQVRLNNIVNNHFTLTKVAQFVSHVEKEFSPVATNEEAYITLWSAHRIETFESYCKDYNTKYTDVTKEAGLILVETVNLLMSLQTLNIDRYSLEPFIVTRNIFGEDPTIAVVQLESIFKEENTLCEVMLSVLRLLVPTWEMTVCLSQVLEQDKPNSLSKCKALLEFWLWGPTGVTVTPDRPLSLKRWLDLERANELHGHVCSRSADLSMKQICYMSFLVSNDDKLFSDTWTVLAKQKMQPPCDSTISKC